MSCLLKKLGNSSENFNNKIIKKSLLFSSKIELQKCCILPKKFIWNSLLCVSKIIVAELWGWDENELETIMCVWLFDCWKRHTMDYVSLKLRFLLKFLGSLACHWTYLWHKHFCINKKLFLFLQLLISSYNCLQTQYWMYRKHHFLSSLKRAFNCSTLCHRERENQMTTIKNVVTTKNMVISMKALAIFKCPTVSWYAEIRKSFRKAGCLSQLLPPLKSEIFFYEINLTVIHNGIKTNMRIKIFILYLRWFIHAGEKIHTKLVF